LGASYIFESTDLRERQAANLDDLEDHQEGGTLWFSNKGLGEDESLLARIGRAAEKI